MNKHNQFKNEAIHNYNFLVAALGIIGFMFSCTPKIGEASTKNNSTEYLSQGKTIYDNSCGKCHDLPNPKEYSAQSWVGIMNSMAPKAKLNESQHQMVYDYIVSVK